MTPTATAPVATPRRPPTTPPSDVTGSIADGLIVVVAPVNGRFHPSLSEGVVAAGTVVGRVTSGSHGSTDVRIPVAASVRGLLTMAGHLVTRGQALAWAQLQPADAAA